MKQFRTKTKITEKLALKINKLFLILSAKEEVSFKEIKKELQLNSDELNRLLNSATYVLPIYESDDKKIGLLK